MAAHRILAVDVGDRRIGLAISDELNLTAQPLFTVQRSTLQADLKAVGRFIRKYDVATLVVGDPLHADGSPSPQSAKSRAFAESLFSQHPSLLHHVLDERLTTQEAHALLDRGGKRHNASDRKERSLLIDQVAAALLLESFLESQHGPSLLPDPDGRPDGQDDT